MCLSRVYLEEINSETIIEEASNVLDNDGIIEINSIFGEHKKLEGFFIKEINLVDNYILLKRKEH